MISPDLTTNDKSHEDNSGWLALDNPPGTYDGAVLYAMDISPVKHGHHLDRQQRRTGACDPGRRRSLDERNQEHSDLPEWGIVTGVHPSPFAAGKAYLTVSFQQTGDYKPYVYKTSDFGNTWTPISSGVPSTMNSIARVCREDPVRQGMLWLGTDDGV